MERYELEELVSKKERQDVPQMEYGKDNKIQVVNMQKAIEKLIKDRESKKQSMVIELNAIKIDKHKELRDTISWAKDLRNGVYYGIPFGVHPDGNIKWRKIPLTERNSFNLRIRDEAAQWIVIRMHPHVKGSPYQDSDPLFQVYDPDIEARKEMEIAMQVKKAIDRAQRMKNSDTLNFYRFTALPMPIDVTPRVIRSELLKLAMSNAKEFNDKYDNPARRLFELFRSAQSLGLVNYELEKGFSYKGQFLGFTDIEVIRFMGEDTIIATAMAQDVKSRDTDQERFTGEADTEIEE